jgi:hypothetical protein
VAVEDIGGLYNTKQPGYDDAADIQAALKAFLYGDYDYDTTSTDPTQLPNPSLAKHLQGLKDRIEDQEELGIGSDYLTLAQIAALTSPHDGYIAMASDSNGGAVESLYASAFYTNEAPTTDIVDGVLWVDKDSDALDTYVYNETDDEWVRINDLKNIIAAKGDLLVGTAADSLDNLTVGANGTVLTADDTQALGVKWQAPSVYSQPTLGTTAIASGSTVTNVDGLTINSTTIPTSKTLVATDSTAYVIPSMSGNSGKYLTNDGSTPSWATISSGGMTLIGTTTLTGVSNTIAVPSGYKNIQLVLRDIQGNTSTYLRVAAKPASGSPTHHWIQMRTGFSSVDSGSEAYSTIMQFDQSSDQTVVINLLDYNQSVSNKIMNWFGAYGLSSGAIRRSAMGMANIETTSPITQFVITLESGGSMNGTALLYGVN